MVTATATPVQNEELPLYKGKANKYRLILPIVQQVMVDDKTMTCDDKTVLAIARKKMEKYPPEQRVELTKEDIWRVIGKEREYRRIARKTQEVEQKKQEASARKTTKKPTSKKVTPSANGQVRDDLMALLDDADSLLKRCGSIEGAVRLLNKIDSFKKEKVS